MAYRAGAPRRGRVCVTEQTAAPFPARVLGIPTTSPDEPMESIEAEAAGIVVQLIQGQRV
jgi:hypothetical protein